MTLEQNKVGKKLTDQQLITNYQSGVKGAMSLLIERHRKRILHYIQILVKDREVADDIFQETFIKVIRFIDEGRYSDNGKFLPWVLRISHNQVIDHFRQTKSEALVSHTNQSGFDMLNSSRFSEQTIEDHIISEQIKDELTMLVELLPEEQMQIVKLRYFGGLSFKEIAEDTGVSINTALGRMRYALSNLRKMVVEKNLL